MFRYIATTSGVRVVPWGKAVLLKISNAERLVAGWTGSNLFRGSNSMNSVRAVCFAVAACLIALVCGTDLRAQEVTATEPGQVQNTTGGAGVGGTVCIKW